MSDTSAFSDAAHFQNWHQQSDESYFWWRDFFDKISTRCLSFIVRVAFFSRWTSYLFVFISNMSYQNLLLDEMTLNLFLEKLNKAFLVGKVQRGKQYFDKMSQMRKPLFIHIAFPPVFFESKIDWMCLRDQIRPSQLPPSSSIFSTISSSASTVLTQYADEIVPWGSISTFFLPTLFCFYCRSSISTTSSATSSSTGSHWTSNSANKLSKVNIFSCFMWSNWSRFSFRLLLWDMANFFVQLGRRLRESCRSLKPRPVRTAWEEKRRKRERENSHWCTSFICEAFLAKAKSQVWNTWTVTCQFKF